MLIFTFDGFIRAVLLLGVFGLFVIFGEYLRRSGFLVGESARKFVHITTGTWAALWPAFLDLNSIALLTFGLAIVALMLRKLHRFQSVYSIRRLSMGEVLIGFGLSASALLADNGAIFSSAVLIIAWSDSMAALIGLKYGKKNSFKVLGSKKSLAGSLAFFATTVLVLSAYMYYKTGSDFLTDPYQAIIGIGTILLASACLTIVELTGVYGLDNLTIPIFATIVLNLISQNF